jgi:MoaA/NifB/PqqE/SkfB family radical SAM enzyme
LGQPPSPNDSLLQRDLDDDGGSLEDLQPPEPVPDLATYLGERERCLAASPACRANFALYMDDARRSAEVGYMPIKLDIENVSRCNFACVMCAVSEWPKGRRAGDMSFAAFKALLDEQYGLVEIKLQGLGEPTLQGEPYFAMIRYARERHIWVRTTTNASLLHLRDNYRKLVDSGVNEIQISIDGADKASYEAIRRQAVFERVVANCRLLNDECARRGIERTKMWVVVQRRNRHQLEALVDLAEQLGFKKLVFSLDLTDFGIASWRERKESIGLDRMLTRSEADDLIARGEAKGVQVRFWRASSKYSTASAPQLCPWPFERAYLSSDLRVVPCCFIGNPDISQFGSAEAGFAKIWFGDAMRDFRAAHLKGDIPPICRGCYGAS